MKKRGFGTLILYILIGLGAYLFLTSASGNSIFGTAAKENVDYNELVEYVQDGKVDTLDIALGKNSASYVEATLKDVNDNGAIIVKSYVPTDEFLQVVEAYSAAHSGSLTVNYSMLSEEGWSSIILTVMTFVVIGFVLFFFISQQNGAGGGRVMNFGKSKAKLYSGSDKVVTFKEVAGADEEKQELAEVVDFLKYPDRYKKLGARIPKGVLLVGPPGTGKTLLARATAGEVGVPFFTISGSDFVEMFVGVGASRVRDLFDSAKKNAPCIVFIDEIDAVGRQRGAGLGGGNDEREQTLNQLLVEMDGFAEHQGIIVIAATNRADILDPALMRPGRFDRQINVNIPDVKGREEILKVHARNKPLAKGVELKTIAKATGGFTGADLENVMNEASLMTARQKLKSIGMPQLQEAIKRVIAGPEKKSRIITENDKKITSLHETGHAVVSYAIPGYDPVMEISIIPRGMAAGYTINLPDNDDNHVSKGKLLDEITVLLAGRSSEEVMLDDICTGASNDIERASKIARKMITDYGMSEKLGPINYAGEGDDVFIGRDMMKSKYVSDEVAADIDRETKDIIDTCHKRAKDIIEKNRAKVTIIADTLLERETLSGDEFKRLYDTGTLEIAAVDENMPAEAVADAEKTDEAKDNTAIEE